MPLHDASCGQCIYSTDAPNAPELCECRRFPPVFAPEDGDSVLVFPTMPRDLWCGEFQRRVN